MKLISPVSSPTFTLLITNWCDFRKIINAGFKGKTIVIYPGPRGFPQSNRDQDNHKKKFKIETLYTRNSKVDDFDEQIEINVYWFL